MASIISRQAAQLFALALAVAAVVAVCLASIPLAALVGTLTIAAVIVDGVLSRRAEVPARPAALDRLTVDLRRRHLR